MVVALEAGISLFSAHAGTIYSADQCYVRGVKSFWGIFFVSGSVSLVRVTLPFLAVTGFRSRFSTYSILIRKKRMVSFVGCTEKVAESVFVGGEVQSRSRASSSDPAVEIGGISLRH